jgi:hypothetical protein
MFTTEVEYIVCKTDYNRPRVEWVLKGRKMEDGRRKPGKIATSGLGYGGKNI